jgi:RimJ/RimL family protein N-acetyltransferase
MSNRAVPTIETERLRLRAFEFGDFDAMFAILSDPNVMEMMGGKALHREEAWRRLLTARGMWEIMGFGYWVIQRKIDDVLIGQAGFADFRRDINPSIEGSLEVGWLLASHAFGSGYATEAATACLRWALQEFPNREVVATIDPNNAASVRVTEKIGEWKPSQASYRGSMLLLLRLVR